MTDDVIDDVNKLSADDITFCQNYKFDIQLSQALIAEKRLADIFRNGIIERIELKTETYQWEKTGNIAIEYKRDGKPSGISVTQATCWVHELRRNDETLIYLMFPINHLKHLCRTAIKQGRFRANAGDGNRQHVVLLRLRDLLKHHHT
jgi:hypothetical protein